MWLVDFTLFSCRKCEKLKPVASLTVLSSLLNSLSLLPPQTLRNCIDLFLICSLFSPGLIAETPLYLKRFETQNTIGYNSDVLPFKILPVLFNFKSLSLKLRSYSAEYCTLIFPVVGSMCTEDEEILLDKEL